MNEIIPNPPAIVRAAVDIKGATAEVCEDWENYLQCTMEGIGYARRMGANLIDIKRSLPHGQWLPYVKQNLPFAVRTAETFMLVSGRWEDIASNRDRAKSVRAALTMLAEIDNAKAQTECLGNSQRAANLSSELDSGQSGESGEAESTPAEPDAPAAASPPPPEPTANGTSGPKKNHPRCARCKRTGKVELCATCKAIAVALKQGPLCKRCLGDGPREDCPDCAGLRRPPEREPGDDTEQIARDEAENDAARRRNGKAHGDPRQMDEACRLFVKAHALAQTVLDDFLAARGGEVNDRRCYDQATACLIASESQWEGMVGGFNAWRKERG